MPVSPRLSIVPVAYNSETYVGKALQALDQAAAGTSSEVIVIDNTSADFSIEVVHAEYPGAKVIASPKNLGVGAACDRGVRQARGHSLLFRNQDSTFFASSTLQ